MTLLVETVFEAKYHDIFWLAHFYLLLCILTDQSHDQFTFIILLFTLTIVLSLVFLFFYYPCSHFFFFKNPFFVRLRALYPL
jgi:hypothetical protein